MINTVFNLEEEQGEDVERKEERFNSYGSIRSFKKPLEKDEAVQNEENKTRKNRPLHIPSLSDIPYSNQPGEKPRLNKFADYLLGSKSRLDMSFRTHQDYALHGHAMQDNERLARRQMQEIIESKRTKDEKKQTLNDPSSSNKSHSKSGTLSKNQNSSKESLKYSSSSALVFIKLEE